MDGPSPQRTSEARHPGPASAPCRRSLRRREAEQVLIPLKDEQALLAARTRQLQSPSGSEPRGEGKLPPSLAVNITILMQGLPLPQRGIR